MQLRRKEGQVEERKQCIKLSWLHDQQYMYCYATKMHDEEVDRAEKVRVIGCVFLLIQEEEGKMVAVGEKRLAQKESEGDVVAASAPCAKRLSLAPERSPTTLQTVSPANTCTSEEDKASVKIFMKRCDACTCIFMQILAQLWPVVIIIHSDS